MICSRKIGSHKIGLRKMNLRKMFLLMKKIVVALQTIPAIQKMKLNPIRTVSGKRILLARCYCFRCNLQKILQKQVMLMNLLEKIF